MKFELELEVGGAEPKDVVKDHTLTNERLANDLYVMFHDEIVSQLRVQLDANSESRKSISGDNDLGKEPEPLDTIEYPTEVMCFKVEDVLKEEDDGIDEISLNLNFESFSNREDLDKFLRKLIPDPRLEGRLPVLGDMFLLTGAAIDNPEQKKLLSILNNVVDKMQEEVKG